MMYHLNMANTIRWTKRSKKQMNKKSKPFTVSLSSVKSRGLKVNKKTTDHLEKLFKSSLKSNKPGKSNQKGSFIATLLAATSSLWLPTVVNTVKKIVH